MRLTLRTMLAHLDGILDPADSEDLARKIAENEFASTLAQRIGDCTKRLRLGAPKVLGKGTALDPNTVAEYLDSTLAPDRMPDFEKVCLESDVHLAEVAACHHILTMIVGQPAQVDAESRRRMYALASTPADAAEAENDVAGTVGAAVRAAESAGPANGESQTDDVTTSVDGFPTQSKPQPRKPQVPDYLREGARQRKMTTAMIFIAAAGIAVAALVFKDPLLRVVGLKPAADTSVSQGDNGGGGNAAIGDDATKPSATQPSDGSGKTPRSSEPIDRNPADDAVTENGSRPRVAPGDADAAAKRSADSAAIPPLPGENLPPSDADAGDKPTGDEPSGDEPPPAPTPPGDAAVPGEAPKQPAVAPRLDRAEPVGKLVSGDQLLLRFDTQAGEGGDWVRVPDGGMVYGGDRIVALPTYRPRLVLGERLLVELVADGHDGTIVDVLAPDAEGTPSLRVVHGRLAKISATGRQSVALRFVFGKQAATATLANATTSLAVLVDRPYAPGEDPMAIADPITATFFATSGTVDVAVEGAPPVAVNEAMQLAVSPAGPSKPAPTSPPPQWVDKSQIGFLEARAASQLMQELTPTASVGLELSEQFHGRRIEDQSFAARSFGYLGRFDPLVTTALKDESLAWTWREKSLEGLRLAMRRGPSTASSVRDALVKEFGDRNGGVMYRMLCGYSPADLKNGGDAKLVENLEHEDLPFRALAVFNLSTIAGETLGYMPEARESLRRTWVVRWRERLQRRQIVYDERSARAPRVADAPPTDAAKPAEGRAAPSGVDVGPLGDAAKETPADTPTTPPAPRNAAPNFPPPPPAGPDGR